MRHLIIFALVISSCATAPPSSGTAGAGAGIGFVGEPELRKAMQEIARSSFALSATLRDEAAQKRASQEKVLALLAEIDAAAERLDPEGMRTAHSVLGPNLPAFRLSIDMAVSQARHTPPNFGPASRLWKSCSGCHPDRT